MNSNDFQSLIVKLRNVTAGTWIDKKHIATDCFREAALVKLNHDPSVTINSVELFLSEELPEIDKFEGIFEVDQQGIWYYDGDGHINDPIWRQRLIPWQYIKGITIHQAS
jgi:hypothetical protein